MITTYLKSQSRSALDELVVSNTFRNITQPTQGRAAIAAHQDPDGLEVPEQPSAGDPAYWYVSILCILPVEPTGSIQACDEAEGTAVCGVWA